MARAAYVGESVLYCNNLGYAVPAVIESVNGTACDISVLDPRQPQQPMVFAAAQDTVSPPTAVGKWNFNATVTASNATAGASGTVNAMRGTVLLASGGATYTMTNSYVGTTTIPFVTVMSASADANATTVKNVAVTASQLVITLSAAPAANCTIGFVLFNG